MKTASKAKKLPVIETCKECNGTGSVSIYETSSGVSGWISVGCSDCNCTGKIEHKTELKPGWLNRQLESAKIGHAAQPRWMNPNGILGNIEHLQGKINLLTKSSEAQKDLEQAMKAILKKYKYRYVK